MRCGSFLIGGRGLQYFLQFWTMLPLLVSREFKIPRRRRPRKRRLKSEFAFFQSLYRLVQLIYFVKCKRPLLEPNSYESYASSERERKFSRCLFRSSIKREIVIVVQWRQRNEQKSVMHGKVVVFLMQPIAFLAFSLSSPTWNLKVPGNKLKHHSPHNLSQVGTTFFYHNSSITLPFSSF